MEDPGLAQRLAESSRDEMIAALGLARAPAPIRRVVGAALRRASEPLGRMLSRFDARIAETGIDRAARAALGDLGANFDQEGEVPRDGALLVLANHPGAYDALVLLSALGRRDVAIVAADREFLRALPALRSHLVFVPELAPAAARAAGVRRALGHLASGGVLLHFPAGRIEPDPAFCGAGVELLHPWHDGTGLLVRGAARVGGRVTCALVGAVHSARAKRLLVTRIAERRGITTLAPLLQVAVPAFHDVRAEVRFGAPLYAHEVARGTNREITERIRRHAQALSLRARAPA